MRMQCHSSQTGRAGHGREMDQPRFTDANARQSLPSFVLGSSREGNDTNPVLPISRPAQIAAERREGKKRRSRGNIAASRHLQRSPYRLHSPHYAKLRGAEGKKKTREGPGSPCVDAV